MLGIKAICDSLPAAAVNKLFTFATGLVVEEFGEVGEARDTGSETHTFGQRAYGIDVATQV